MKRLLCVLTVVLLILPLGLNCTAAFDSVILISTAQELNAFAARVNNGENNLRAKLTANINLSETTNYAPIGNYLQNRPYAGTFDGNGHAITGLNLNTSAKYKGVFGYLYNATIENLSVCGAITTSSQYTGGLAGAADGRVIIRNCSTDVDICYTPGGDATAGGILAVADVESIITIENCYVLGDITTQGSSLAGLGGIVGVARIDSTVTVRNCYCTSEFMSDNVTKSAALTRTYADYNTLIFDNSYSYNPSYVTAQGETMTAEQVQSGELAWLMGDAFGQNLESDTYPVFAAPGNAVYKVTYIGAYTGVSYTNAYVTLPEDGNNVFHYSFTVNGTPYTGDVPLTVDITIATERSSDYTHLVTFKSMSGAVLSSSYEDVGVKPNFPEVSKFDGAYTFKQWNVTTAGKETRALTDDDFDNTANLVITAVYTIDHALIDAQNANNAQWQDIPMATQSMLENGYYGEGCQWPTNVEYSADGSVAFFGTDCGGMFRSFDDGLHWEACNTGLTARGVMSFAIDPYNNDHVLCIGSGSTAVKASGIFISDDCGDTWDKVYSLAIFGYRYTKDSFEFDPTSYDAELGACTTVYLSTPYREDPMGIDDNAPTKTGLTDDTAGLYKSTDGGATWARVNPVMYDSFLQVDPQNGHVYCANANGFYVSTDGGVTFTAAFTDNITGFDMITYNRALRLYISTPDGVYYNFDRLQTGFTKIISENYMVSSRRPKNIAVSSVNPNYMMITARADYRYYYTASSYYSHDGGVTWTKTVADNSTAFLPLNGRERVYAFSNYSENVLITFGGDNVSRSTDGGVTLKGTSGISDVMLGGKFSFNVYDSDIMFFAAQDTSGAVTTDGGQTWKRISFGYNNAYGGYAASDMVYFAGVASYNYDTRYIAITFDGGKTYTVTDHALSYSVLGWDSSYQSLRDPQILFCGNWRSVDGGHNWQPMTGCVNVYTGSKLSGALYGCEEKNGYVVVSYDDGETWQRVNNQPLNAPYSTLQSHIMDVAVDHVTGIVYAVCQNHLFKINTDGSWQDITAALPKSELNGGYWEGNMYTVCTDQNNPEIIYAGAVGNIYLADAATMRSVDGGKTWQVLTVNTRNSVVSQSGVSGGNESSCLRVVPETGELWAGSACFGFSKIAAPYTLTGHEIHTVTFMSDGEYAGETEVRDGQAVAPIELEKANNALAGYTLNGQQYDLETPVTQDITLNAVWTVSVTVNCMAFGELSATYNVPYGEIPEGITASEYDGYIFAGWFTAENADTAFDITQPITNDVVIYAGYYINLFDPDVKDYSAYIAYANRAFKPSTYNELTRVGNNASVTNRIATITVSGNTEYTIRLMMDTRLRVGSTATLVKNMVMTNCTIHDLDNNGTASVGQYCELTHTTAASDRQLALFYWTSTGAMSPLAVRSTIQVFDATNIVF